MSDLIPGGRKDMARGRRVDRASNLIFAAGTGAVVFVVTLVLAIAGVIGGGIPFVVAILTAAFGYAAYRTVKR